MLSVYEKSRCIENIEWNRVVIWNIVVIIANEPLDFLDPNVKNFSQSWEFWNSRKFFIQYSIGNWLEHIKITW